MTPEQMRQLSRFLEDTDLVPTRLVEQDGKLEIEWKNSVTNPWDVLRTAVRGAIGVGVLLLILFGDVVVRIFPSS